MKRLTAAIAAISLSFTLAACGGTPAAGPSSQTDIATASVSPGNQTAVDASGAWEINQGSLALDDNSEAREVLRKAVAKDAGHAYEGVAYLASQMVAGTNYSFLCRDNAADDDSSPYSIITVYADFDGNAEITDRKTITADTSGSGTWTYSEDASLSRHPDVSGVFANATASDATSTADSSADTYDAIAYLAIRSRESGTDYLIFADSSTADTRQKFMLFTIATDTKGNVVNTKSKNIDVTLDTEDTSDDSTADPDNTSDADDTDGTDQTPNPFQEVDSLDAAADIVGFHLAVPDAPTDYPVMTVRVMGTSMIEVIFTNDADEEGYRIRKQAGDSDISGDYTSYASVETQTISDITVTEKGDGAAVSVATWTSEGYSYAVDAQNHPFALVDMNNLVTDIIARNACPDTARCIS